jgi:carbonyl reductase 1
VVATSRAGGDFGLFSSSSPSSSAAAADKSNKVVSYAKLDIASSESIQSFAENFKQNHPSGLHVLINNAGINVNAEDSQESVERTLNVNYRGTLEV